MSVESDIFRQGSRTYFWSSRFFPKTVREDVFRLYSFVRVADNYVDETPKHPEKLRALDRAWQQYVADPKYLAQTKLEGVDKRILENMAHVYQKYNMKPEWVAAFLTAMKADINPQPYQTLEDSLHYVYGSAEVIGLMMAQIMGLPAAARKAAQYQGRAMQWVNFIRDVEEDNGLGRLYFPQEDLKKFMLPDLHEATARQNPDQFAAFMRFQLGRYHEWQQLANKGMHHIPRRMRIPLRTATYLYNWTAKQIEQDPMIVYHQKVKPTKPRLLSAVAWSTLHG